MNNNIEKAENGDFIVNYWNIKPIIKFNGAIGAILCNQCRIIIKTNLNKDEFEGKTDILFCSDRCQKDYYLKHFPII